MAKPYHVYFTQSDQLALHVAVKQDDVMSVHLLLKHGASVNLQAKVCYDVSRVFVNLIIIVKLFC